DGRACSRPRQWKHGHERARLTVNTATAISRLQKKFRKKFSRESQQSTVERDGHLRWQGKIWRVIRLRARRQKANIKRQKSRMKQVIHNFADLALRQTIFAFCLLPLAFAFVRSTLCVIISRSINRRERKKG